MPRRRLPVRPRRRRASLRVWPIAAALLLGTGCDALFGLDKVDPVTSPCTFASVATGRDHTCTIDGARRVWCWGLNDVGQVDGSGVRNVYMPRQITFAASRGRPVQVATGRAFSCVRFDTGGVTCWGANEAGQLGTGPGGVAPMAGLTDVPLPERVVDLGAGSDYACALRESDRGVMCWGGNATLSLGRTDVMTAGEPALVAGTQGAKRLAVGHRHNCIVDGNDQVQCWGRGGAQQNGLGIDSAAPVAITGLAPVSDVSVGGRTSCALEMTGGVRCWGAGHDGQLGNGTFNATTLMPSTPSVTDALLLQVGARGGCAARDNANDNIACWGLSDVGSGPPTAGASPRTATLADVSQLSHRFHHTCAIVGEQLYCWGSDDEGQLGRGSRSSTPLPVDLAEATLFAVGDRQACAVFSGTLMCWGMSSYGELGINSLKSSPLAVAVDPNLGALTGIVAGWHRVCAWKDTAARCWGTDEFGEVGNGTQTRHVSLPALVSNLTSVSTMALGLFHTCAVSTAGTMSCWGRNHFGQLGTGTTTSSATPMTVALTNVTSIAAGSGHTCAVTNSVLECWGYNASGQLGTGTTANALLPTQVTLPAAPVSVAAGTKHTCAVLAGGELYCWGFNYRGELGVGDHLDRLSPVRVTLPEAVTSVTLAGEGSCAQLVSGKVMCWGAGTRNELGNGTLEDALSPVEVPALAGATKVVRSQTGGCALRNGVLACWGSNWQIPGSDATNSEAMPVPLNCR